MIKKLLLLFLLPLTALGQTYPESLEAGGMKLHKEIEVGAFAATSENNPFWIRNNQFGTVPRQSGGIQFRARIAAPKKKRFVDENLTRPLAAENFFTKRGFKFDYSVEVIGNLGRTNQFLLPEVYGSVRWKGLELHAGRRRDILGIVDTTMTSGSYIWSGNALPVPKVQLSTAGYVPIIGKGLISINAGVNHGWFSDNGIVENYYLHQKWLYAKIGKKRLQVYGGLNHQAQWGGYSEILKGITNVQYPPTINGYLAPYPLYSYQFVLIPFLQKFKNLDPTKVPGYDGGLAIGNQLGSVDIGASWDTDDFSLFFYHQHPYDFARSISKLNNLEDGNNGISVSFKNKKVVQKVLFEYLSTVSQGRYRFGKENSSNSGEVDNYFTHGQYRGWYYEDKILGTPFVQVVSVDGYERTNNRVRAFTFAVEGLFRNISYTGRYAYARSLGTYGSLVDLRQSYLLLDLSKDIKPNQRLNLKIAADIGQIEDSNGIGTRISYQMLL